MNRRNLLITALCCLLLLLMVFTGGCDSEVPNNGEPAATATPLIRQELLVGICLPEESTAWTATGEILKKQFSDAGYRVSLQFGDGSAQAQNQLLLSLIAQKADCIVLSPVDSAAMEEATGAAMAQNIPVLSYGSLLMDTEAVAGYVCYDYREMGVSIAKYIEQTFALANAEREGRSYTAELFMGSPEDYNAMMLHTGIMSVLSHYLSAGVLESKSRRTAFEDSCIYGWSEGVAEKACTARLERSYGETVPDICICASDAIASGVIRSLTELRVTDDRWPCITGNGATGLGLANLEAGKQAMTVRTDPNVPAAACLAMADYILLGTKPGFSLATTFNNVTEIPTALCGFTIVEGE